MAVPSDAIDQVRAFNRDYTRRLGLLSHGWLDSPYSLTQVRVLYEIAHHPGIQAAELAATLGLDRGYLSRLLKGFESRRLLQRTAAAGDARRRHLRLTAPGLRAFAPLERRSQDEVRRLLAALDAGERRSVLGAMRTLREAFAAGAAGGAAPITLREHRVGDLGWVIERHGALYFEEFGWNEQFEALVAGIAAEFARTFDAAREHCWIAEQDGRRVGCIFLVAENATTAKLRLLLVEPAARGSGLGRRLIEECVRFARAAGYARIVLWTQATLAAARHLYQRAGFVLLSQEPHVSFGHALTGETWELRLTPAFPAATPRVRRAVKR
jgi:DNA-binding MarR family transcriptional regulator/N-acetylglutamate synthase-like GNAT family acetyltransferase